MKTHEIKLINGEIAKIIDTDKFKVLKSKEYNFYFNKETGFFVRFGLGDYTNKKRKLSKLELEIYLMWCNIWKTKFNIQEFALDLDTDGNDRLFLPNIADIEISTRCKGVSINGSRPSPCKMCYKSNTNNGIYMTTENFINIADKLSPLCSQIALGIGNIDQPNLFEIMDVCLEKGIIPNITINGYGMTTEIYDKLAERCGAISVSYYDKDLCFDAIHELATIRNMKQINIHAYTAENSFETVLQLIDDLQTDERVKNMNAVVLLQAKIRGNAKINNHTQLSQEKFNILSQKLLKSGILYGSDSCGAFKTLESFKNEPNIKDMEASVMSCESSIESCYINVNGDYFPCSFSEGIDSNGLNWVNGLSVLDCNNFFEDIWFHERTRQFSESVLECRKCKKSCPIFEI